MISAVVRAVLVTAVSLAPAHTSNRDWADRLVREIRSDSFLILLNKDVRVQEFESRSDYFQARFSILRFLTRRRMHYSIRVNSATAVLAVPEEAKRAIIAHELAHVTYYAEGNRIRLVGLIRLASKGFRERFERRADLDALRRGYAQGLKQYRIWLYQHGTERVLKEKWDYLTPEEIDTIQSQTGK